MGCDNECFHFAFPHEYSIMIPSLLYFKWEQKLLAGILSHPAGGSRTSAPRKWTRSSRNPLDWLRGCTIWGSFMGRKVMRLQSVIFGCIWRIGRRILPPSRLNSIGKWKGSDRIWFGSRPLFFYSWCLQGWSWLFCMPHFCPTLLQLPSEWIRLEMLNSSKFVDTNNRHYNTFKTQEW